MKNPVVAVETRIGVYKPERFLERFFDSSSGTIDRGAFESSPFSFYRDEPDQKASDLVLQFRTAFRGGNLLPFQGANNIHSIFLARLGDERDVLYPINIAKSVFLCKDSNGESPFLPGLSPVEADAMLLAAYIKVLGYERPLFAGRAIGAVCGDIFREQKPKVDTGVLYLTAKSLSLSIGGLYPDSVGSRSEALASAAARLTDDQWIQGQITKKTVEVDQPAGQFDVHLLLRALAQQRSVQREVGIGGIEAAAYATANSDWEEAINFLAEFYTHGPSMNLLYFANICELAASRFSPHLVYIFKAIEMINEVTQRIPGFGLNTEDVIRELLVS
ncbi:MAG: hypothetical protein AABZ57_08210 [Candidatus Margulisiibacteriota bacterium]